MTWKGWESYEPTPACSSPPKPRAQGLGLKAQGAKPSKYHAQPCKVDGIRFDSQKEAKHYGELKLREKAGEITGLILQPRYALHVIGNGAGNEPAGFSIQVGVYVADFTYFDCGTKLVVVTDVKGVKTPVYRLKKKMAEAEYGIQIQEV